MPFVLIVSSREKGDIIVEIKREGTTNNSKKTWKKKKRSKEKKKKSISRTSKPRGAVYIINRCYEAVRRIEQR